MTLILLVTLINGYIVATRKFSPMSLFNIHFIISGVCQFLMGYNSSGNFSCDQIISFLNQLNQYRVEKRKIITICIVIIFVTLETHVAINSITLSGIADSLFMSFAMHESEVSEVTGYILFVISILYSHNLAFSYFVYALRYSTLIYGISLLTQQNVTFINTLIVQCGVVNVNHLWKIEKMYLTYVEIIEKLNSTHGKEPFWFLFSIYVSTIILGSFIVLSDGEKSALSLIPQHTFFMSFIVCFALSLIVICERCYSSMEQFRRQGLILANSFSKQIQTPNQTCVSPINTLRGISLSKMKAGKMFDMEYSLFLSLVASAIPTCVMIVSLLKEVKWQQSMMDGIDIENDQA